MATLPFSATTGVTASRFFFGSLWRSVLTWSEELNRAHAATYRYEQLRIGRGNNVPRQDRASKARQVFAELYPANRFSALPQPIARVLPGTASPLRPLRRTCLEPKQGAKS